MAAVIALPIALVVAAGGGILVMGQPDVYRSQTLVILDQPRLVAEGDAAVLVKLNNIRSKYVALVPTRGIAEPVAAELDVPLNTVKEAISAFPLGNTLMIATVARAGSADLAENLSQTTAEELVRFLEREQDLAGVAEADQMEMQIVEDASDARRIQPTEGRALVVAVVAGGLTFAIAYVVVHALSERRHEPDA